MTTKHDCLTTIADRIATTAPTTCNPIRDYDLEAIADDFHRAYGTWDIDTLEPALFWALVHRHSTIASYHPELTPPTTTPATGLIAIGAGRSTDDHDLRQINLNGFDVALELIRIMTDHTDNDGPATDRPTPATDDLADLITTVRAMTGEATEAVLIAAIRELITGYLPQMLDPAATAGFLIELADHNSDRTPTAQVPRIRATRCLPPNITAPD